MASGNPDYGFDIPSGGLDLVGVSNTDIFLRASTIGDTYARYMVDYAGRQYWGSGIAAYDSSLVRVGVGEMRFNCGLEVQATLSALASCVVWTVDAAVVPLTVRLMGGQTADAIQVRDSSNILLFGVDKDGNAAAAGSFNAGSLQVNGPATIAGDLDLDANNSRLSIVGAGTHQIELTGATSGRLGQDGSGFFFASDTSGGAVRFLTNDGTLHEVMRVTSDQRVGIGNTAPGKALDVTGDVRASLQLISTVAIGTPPLAVTSTTEVVNLNADRVGGTEITNAAAVNQVLVGTGAGTAAWTDPGASGGLGYLITMGGGATSPLDSTTYFAGGQGMAKSWQTIWNNARVYIHKAATVKSYFVRFFLDGVAGSNENVSLYLRLNDTTDFGNTTIQMDTIAHATAVVTGLTQALVAGDYLALKIVTPAWATNPTSVHAFVQVYVE